MTPIRFQTVPRNSYAPAGLKRVITLKENNWDDFGYKTMFYASYYDEMGQEHELGDVKIGYLNQDPGWTSEHLPKIFERVPEGFFSLGQSTEYYATFRRVVPDANAVLDSLGDLVTSIAARQVVYQSRVFSDSLTRTVSVTTIENQFARILKGEVLLTPFDFVYERAASEKFSAISLEFKVRPESKPPTNVHVIIGRNGVGKTTLLNGMATAVATPDQVEPSIGQFVHRHFFGTLPIGDDYFSSVSSVSFSAFDPFNPPPDNPDRSKGPKHFYIGLKKTSGDVSTAEQTAPVLKNFDDLSREFATSLNVCLSQQVKRKQWLECISILESDPNFEEMDLAQRATNHQSEDEKGPAHFFRYKMSSGHAVVLLTLTRLVETIEEKTLVIIDEPESHLHPPLLSAFVRALSHLLTSTNAVAIIATHSPVLLQEVPQSCVWKLRRSKLASVAERPERETFGENVGILTRSVFGLEVAKSGFHKLLADSVKSGSSFDELMDDYACQIGMEGQAIARALVHARDHGKESE